jgi:OOP family OmpA-OmpF porin
MSRVTVIAAVLAPLVGAGCAVTRENQGACKATATVVGVLVGGGAAGAGVGVGTSNDAAGAGAGAGGAVVGGLVGYVLGNHFCQVPEAPPPPLQPPPPRPAPKHIELSADTYFDFDKATLKPAGKERIDAEIVRPMTEHPELRALVEGHTDSIGSEAYNQRLSERRANAVRDYMVGQGIAPSRITTKGWGKSKPVADNKTKEGRAKNRRVEVTEE